jgi:hypothetical protein
MGSWVATAASIIPLTLGLDAIRQLLFGAGPSLGFLSVTVELAILSVLAVIFIVGAHLALATVGLQRAWRRVGALRRYSLVAGTQVLVFTVAWVRWALAVEGTDQARLLYPALAAAAPLAAVGLLQWAPRRRETAVAVTAALMLAVNVTPGERSTAGVHAAAVPRATRRACRGGAGAVRDRLRWGWRSAEAVSAGDALDVDTCGRRRRRWRRTSVTLRLVVGWQSAGSADRRARTRRPTAGRWAW